MATTQKERIASLEAARDGHERAHELIDRVWAAKLDAIEQRLIEIEAVLQASRLQYGAASVRLVSKRDLGVFSGSVAFASVAWWAIERLELLAGM